ncbi:aminotransferase class III-fold pyridoxal phosphate-dependent enzyme [Bacillus aerolatus]|uniref:Aminotransferase class III-fold pyridoxal phosphate-dependent enzyme n=1 Tax=Bacillus aerolatus TaxID=2653354 RepID=A0A6I1FNJ0_9BACI|nr:aspartate aminotransferase family protein [Bacillus aerolatus]KAB7708837.1 aminotransferase class III-fold pyridoxal phosphate-dependent enzyme [Bacillus aerolatus]
MTVQETLTNQLAELDKKYFIHPTSSIKEQQENGPAIIFKEGKGIYLTDINGKKYIEGMASLWNVNVGYGRKELAEAAKEQLETLPFASSFATFSNEPAIRLAAKVADMAPGDLNAVFFTSGGSESNDTSYKLVRHYWKIKGQPNKTKIIARERAYHGVAVGSTSATGIKDFHHMTTSLATGFVHTESFSPDALRKTIEAEGADTIAAFIAEPVQGAGGVNIPQDGYFQEIRQICDEYNILLIADEVITGFGRTGKMFACEHWGIVPDVMLLAKGISSGYIPLGAVVVRDHIHQDFIKLSEGTLLHGFTYSGHPTACAVGLKNIEILERENLVQNSKEMGALLHEKLKALQSETNIVGEVRFLGLVGALEIVKDQETNERFSQKLAPQIITEARKRGLILRTVVFGDSDTIVFSPPLVINEEEVNELVSILKEAILEVQKTV